MLRKFLLPLSASLIGACLSTSPVLATTTYMFDFWYSGTDVSGSGGFIAQPAGNDQYKVTDVIGSANGHPITGINSSYGLPDNLLWYPQSTNVIYTNGFQTLPPSSVSSAGISFNTSDGNTWNIGNITPTGNVAINSFTNPSAQVYPGNPNASGYNYTPLTNFTVSAPQPIVSVTDFVNFADAAYGKTPLTVAGYHDVPLSSLSSSPLPNPAQFLVHAYSNSDGSRVVLAIAGSDDIADWVGANPSFISPAGPTSTLTNDVNAAAAILEAIKNQYRNANIVLTGHSLGGAIAQILANATGLQATTFDAPGVGALVPYFSDFISGSQIFQTQQAPRLLQITVCTAI